MHWSAQYVVSSHCRPSASTPNGLSRSALRRSHAVLSVSSGCASRHSSQNQLATAKNTQTNKLKCVTAVTHSLNPTGATATRYAARQRAAAYVSGMLALDSPTHRTWYDDGQPSQHTSVPPPPHMQHTSSFASSCRRAKSEHRHCDALGRKPTSARQKLCSLT